MNIPTYAFLLIFAFAIIGIILGGAFDLQLSKAIVDPNDPLANFFETFGLYFGYAAMEIMLVMFFASLYKRKQLFLKVVAWAALILVNAYLIYSFNGFLYLSSNSKVVLFGLRFENIFLSLLVTIILLVGTGVGTFFLLDKNPDKENYLLFLSIMMIICLGLRLGASEFLKRLGGRPRYRFLFNLGGIFDGKAYTYRDWWEFAFFSNPHNDYFASWPSGHTMSSVLLLLLIAFPSVSKKRFRGDTYVIFGAALAYTLVMMFMRIRIGAHYLSDVSMGLLLCSLFVYLTLYFFEANKERVLPKIEGEPESVK